MNEFLAQGLAIKIDLKPSLKRMTKDELQDFEKGHQVLTEGLRALDAFCRKRGLK